MKVSQKELNHLLFLSQVVLEGKKRGMMEETMQCLIYILKSLEEVELPVGVVERMDELVERIEDDLRSENVRLQEINSNLSQPIRRNPFG